VEINPSEVTKILKEQNELPIQFNSKIENLNDLRLNLEKGIKFL
jgi:hypothetical protein